ncbi:MAG: flagellar motor switch phosphatase FliY [Oscillospiraceae bacterium]|jgi:flagellar motor switch protein FliN/FliY|nr:flagellar motor switch phosphatase FliY [Oscillospiraceae bacterium]
MSNGLSQAEIDALLSGGGSPEGSSETPVADDDPGHTMSPEEVAAAFAAAGVGAEQEEMSQEEIAAAFSAATELEKELTEEDIAQISVPEEEVVYGPGLPVKEYSGVLSDIEKDAMGEIGNISMGTSATTLFALLNRRVDITTPRVSVTTMNDIATVYPIPFVAVEVRYTDGLEGVNVIFLQERDVKIITDLMLGGDGTNTDGPLNDMHMSCISEVMNQMIGSASTSLSKLLNITIDISPPQAYSVNLRNPKAHPFADMDDVIVRTAFDMVVEGLINSEIMQVTPIPFAKSMVASMTSAGEASAAKPPAPAAKPAAPPPAAAQAPTPPPQYQQPEAPPQAPGPYAQPAYPPYPPQEYPPQGAYPGYPPYPPQGYYPPPQQAPPARTPPGPVYDYKAAQYQSFDDVNAAAAGENMDLLLDVPLSVSVELGKSKKFIREIVEFSNGSIIVLDKMAGELVDVVVNGKLIAKGEVVVIEENYGVRITDIVSASKRLNVGN